MGTDELPTRRDHIRRELLALAAYAAAFGVLAIWSADGDEAIHHA